MAEGHTEYGETYRVTEMTDFTRPKTIPVQMVRRLPDGTEEPGHTLNEAVRHGYTTLDEAVTKAVALWQAGTLVRLDHIPDGRSGSSTPNTLCDALTFATIMRESQG
jgi:hypothetical protein